MGGGNFSPATTPSVIYVRCGALLCGSCGERVKAGTEGAPARKIIMLIDVEIYTRYYSPI